MAENTFQHAARPSPAVRCGVAQPGNAVRCQLSPPSSFPVSGGHLFPAGGLQIPTVTKAGVPMTGKVRNERNVQQCVYSRHLSCECALRTSDLTA